MIVCKFGGSSVADANQLRKVKAIVDKNEDRKILIVSAPGKRNKEDIKVTDLLYASSEAAKTEGSCKSVFAQVRERYLDIMRDLELDTCEMSKSLDEVEKKIDEGAGSDYAASRGEYLNARLISIFFEWEFVDAEDLIVINENGTINEITWEKCKERLSGSNYIIPGFYGKSLSNKVKTFSRGGSDISGSIISKAVGASIYENWTDVAGCYNADPRVIDGAYPIPEMTYREVRELSIVGASVFHPEAIVPVHEAGIPINIKNTNADEEKGTMIKLDRDDSNSEIIGVSAETGYTKLTINKLLLMVEPGIYNVILSVLKTNGITPRLTFINPDSICWFFLSKDITDNLLDELGVRLIKEFKLNSFDYTRNLAIVGLVGQGLKNKPAALAKSISALNDSNIGIDSINFGSSLTMYISVNEKDSRDAVQSIFDVNFR